jgi:hypothetical protein
MGDDRTWRIPLDENLRHAARIAERLLEHAEAARRGGLALDADGFASDCACQRICAEDPIEVATYVNGALAGRARVVRVPVAVEEGGMRFGEGDEAGVLRFPAWNIADHCENVAAFLREQAPLAERYRGMAGGFRSCPCARACRARGPVGFLDGDEERFAILKRRPPEDRYAEVDGPQAPPAA